MTVNKLTEREQQCLAHLRQAEELGVSLREYADAYGLEVKALYQGKRQLSKKGLLGEQVDAARDFVAVHIGDTPVSLVCQLQHPSGWEISSNDWPPAAWLSAVLSGGNDAA